VAGGAAGAAGFDGTTLFAGGAGIGRDPGAAPEPGTGGLVGNPAGFCGAAGRSGDPAGPAAAGAAGLGVGLAGTSLGDSAMGAGLGAGAATGCFAVGRGDCISSPSRFTAKTALQTLQRARTPPSGTLAGSTR
jgi:hypothetical protein